MSTPSGFNLQAAADDLRVEDDGTTFEVRDRQGEIIRQQDGRPVTMTVLGFYAKRVQAAKTKWQRKLSKRTGRRLTEDQSAAELALDLGVAATVAWEGFASDDGTPVECTPEHVRTWLDTLPYLLEQVTEVMHDHEGFSKTTSTGS